MCNFIQYGLPRGRQQLSCVEPGLVHFTGLNSLTVLSYSVCAVPHEHAANEIKTTQVFVRNDRFDFGSKVLGGNFLESESRVKRHVPRQVSKRCQCDPGLACLLRPVADCPYEC